MPGPELDVVAERKDAIVKRGEDLARTLGLLDREVGPGHIAAEERVAAEERPRLARGVADEEGGVLRPMAGRVERLQGKLAQLEPPAVGEGLVGVVDAGVLMNVDGRAGGGRESPVPGDVIGVVVGLEHVLDPHSVKAAEAQVGVDVPLRIDHCGDPVVADQVGGATEVLVQNLPEQHGAARYRQRASRLIQSTKLHRANPRNDLSPATPPNILYIHSHDTGRYVQPYGFQVPTPNIQLLADQGVLFREAFCAAPTCSGSRASLLTGQYCHNKPADCSCSAARSPAAARRPRCGRRHACPHPTEIGND